MRVLKSRSKRCSSRSVDTSRDSARRACKLSWRHGGRRRLRRRHGCPNAGPGHELRPRRPTRSRRARPRQRRADRDVRADGAADARADGRANNNPCAHGHSTSERIAEPRLRTLTRMRTTHMRAERDEQHLVRHLGQRLPLQRGDKLRNTVSAVAPGELSYLSGGMPDSICLSDSDIIASTFTICSLTVHEHERPSASFKGARTTGCTATTQTSRRCVLRREQLHAQAVRWRR